MEVCFPSFEEVHLQILKDLKVNTLTWHVLIDGSTRYICPDRELREVTVAKYQSSLRAVIISVKGQMETNIRHSVQQISPSILFMFMP